MKPYIYEARVGKVGQVAFYKDPKTSTYCFYFYNGKKYTPLYLSEDAAYYVWAFIGCEHPYVPSDKKYQIRKTNLKNFASTKKAGRGKPKKKQPSLTTKKKAKSK